MVRLRKYIAAVMVLGKQLREDAAAVGQIIGGSGRKRTRCDEVTMSMWMELELEAGEQPEPQSHEEQGEPMAIRRDRHTRSARHQQMVQFIQIQDPFGSG